MRFRIGWRWHWTWWNRIKHTEIKAWCACFDYALEVATAFDSIVTNNPQCTLTDDTLITNYQNHVLHNVDYKIYWSKAIKDNSDLKNDDDTFKPGTFKKSGTVSLIMLPLLVAPLLPTTAFSITYVVVRRSPTPWPLNHPPPASRKRCMLLNGWTIIMKKNLVMTKQKSFSSILFPKNTSKIMFTTVNATLMTRLLKI